jgi:uncharacterized membrane protein SirB2
VSLLPWYLQIKQAHIGLVLASGLLFAVRGAAVLAGQSWAMHKPWRWLSYGIDTVLLSAGVALWGILSLNLLHSPWLGTKLLLLVVYIVLGSLALKRAPTPAVRRLSYAAALGTYLFMASVAVAHHPLGVLHTWPAAVDTARRAAQLDAAAVTTTTGPVH